MEVIWIISVVIFVGAIVFMWYQSRKIKDKNQFTNGFIKGHRACKTFPYQRWRYMLFFILAIAFLVLGIWLLFQNIIEPPVAYALISFSLAVGAISQSMRFYYENQLIFYSKGFVWDEQVFPYKNLEVTETEIIDEVPIPLDSTCVKKIREEYEAWKIRRDRDRVS